MSVVVFDLDGTLVSSRDDLVAALNFVLEGAGYRAVSPQAMHNAVGYGAKYMLKQGLEANGISGTDAMIEPLYLRFLEHYEANMAAHTRPFPGVVDALRHLRENGWRLAVCTNKIERLTLPLLDRLDMTGLFDAVVGGDTFSVSKPEAEPVIGAIQRAGGQPAGSVMVGDSGTDINAARAAGIPVVAVDFGYTLTPVSELGPDRIISHFDELTAAIASLSHAP